MITKYKDYITENIFRTEKDPEYYGITKYAMVDGKLDCHDDVDLRKKGFDKLPFKFGKITGDFYCGENQLTSLEGCPHTVFGHFRCDNNLLTNMIGCPHTVYDDIVCYNNRLTSLEGCPKNINGTLHCFGNGLTDLVGCPETIKDDFYCDKNQLTSLVGCPKIINGIFECSINKLTDLDGCPDIIRQFQCNENELLSIEDYPIKSDIEYITISDCHFIEIFKLVRNNIKLFEPLRNDKEKFHQMVMRLEPSLIQYYRTISSPSKKSILLDI